MGHCINKYRVRYQVDDKKDKSVNVEGEEAVLLAPLPFFICFWKYKKKSKKTKRGRNEW